MQLMTWPLARLGSRLGLLFEPHARRIMHSALGRFCDQPLDLAVGLIDPDGTPRVMPFTPSGQVLYGCEQFERINSITFRGYSEAAGVRLELNLHAPFYPQDEQISLLPVFYVELRAIAAPRVRWRSQQTTCPINVQLFCRLKRPDTQIDVSDGCIDLTYDESLVPRYEADGGGSAETCGDNQPVAHVRERIVSLNEGATAMTGEDGSVGLTLQLPVTEESSGVKWRLVWAAHTADPILNIHDRPARFRYVRHWPDLDAVMNQAVASRDDNLSHSRRFERLLEQAPMIQARRHLLALGFQSYLSNTFWCDSDDGREWFSSWEGSCRLHSTVDVEYNVSLLYLSVWPRLLEMMLRQWAEHADAHAESGGVIVRHDIGGGLTIGSQAYPHGMPVEENANFLLLLQTYIHWTAHLAPLQEHAEFVRRAAEYLLWTDRDGSGFASEGTANTIDDAAPAIQYARKQTYLAIKRVAALEAAADLLGRVEDASVESSCRQTAERCVTAASGAVRSIESAAWLGDHYAVCIDTDATGMRDVWTGQPLPIGPLRGWDDYSIYTANGLLLHQLIAWPCAFDTQRLIDDLTNATRETLTPYGCGHSSSDAVNVWISQNLWRDLTGRYLGAVAPQLESRYWDLQTYSNTGDQSFGFIDTYIGNELAFYPRGAVTFGYFLAGPRLCIDRLGGDKPFISVAPDRFRHSRWPLLPLADWKAGRVPVCTVDADGNAIIEGALEPVIVKGPAAPDTIG